MAISTAPSCGLKVRSCMDIYFRMYVYIDIVMHITSGTTSKVKVCVALDWNCDGKLTANERKESIHKAGYIDI